VIRRRLPVFLEIRVVFRRKWPGGMRGGTPDPSFGLRLFLGPTGRSAYMRRVLTYVGRLRATCLAFLGCGDPARIPCDTVVMVAVDKIGRFPYCLPR